MNESFFLEEVVDLDQIELPKRAPRIERVPVVEHVEGTVICDRLFRLPTHFNGVRTSLCPGKATCGIHKTAALRIYFLCALYIPIRSEAIWYQLPAPAAKCLLLGAKTLGRSIHGLSVKLARKWKEKNAPVILKLDPYTDRASQLPKPITPEESVRRCFFSDVEKTSTKKRKAV